MTTEKDVLTALSHVKDPELGRDLVSLNMVKNVRISEGLATFTLELTTPACPLKAQIEREAVAAVRSLPGIDRVEVDLTSNVVARRRPGKIAVDKVRNVLCVASGKGGVGKSTVTVNFSVALGAPIVWRGPMVGKLISDFLRQVDWGDLDYLVVDLPPGTGDASLTLIQQVPLSGVVIVTTPQEAAVTTAGKALHMFKGMDVPILGIVENMSGFACPHCGVAVDIFAKGGGKEAARELKVPFLGEIPLDPDIRASGDHGLPFVLADPESQGARAFHSVAEQVAARISIENARDLQGFVILGDRRITPA
ncbi:MAG: Mrp/NBP35 family ATP-binding protein [Armatimonadetes bacterium]|nr:Mrp/NBP35 family ATP-binding protein [Armatimonadota bacterium]